MGEGEGVWEATEGLQGNGVPAHPASIQGKCCLKWRQEQVLRVSVLTLRDSCRWVITRGLALPVPFGFNCGADTLRRLP